MASPRPTDEDIIAYENQIRDEIAATRPLVGPQLPIGAGLVEEYAGGNFRAKAADIAQRYAGIRHTRGDGNCFFRAFAFGLVCAARGWAPGGAALGAVLAERVRARLFSSPFDAETYADFLDELLPLLDGPAPGALGAPDDLAAFWAAEEYRSHAAVVALRLVASAEMRARADDFAPFLSEDVASFCQAHVECMGVESDQVHVTALADALSCCVRIAYLDAADGPLNVVSIGPEDALFAMDLLYRPGHYDYLVCA